ncbi:cytochrome P450, partial [Tanacetum coccineum]
MLSTPKERKKFKSLRLIDPILRVRGSMTQQIKQKKKNTLMPFSSQPIPSNSSGKILSKPDVATSSESNEVDNTIDVGNEIGLTGKNKDIQNILAKGDMNRLVLKSMWINSQFENVVKNSEGNSGGIVAIWDNTLFTLSSSLEGDGFLAIVGNWYNINIHCLIIIVYAPQDQRRKRKLWKDITQLILIHNNLTIVLGDFNEVRNVDEQKGTMFDPRGDSRF